MLKKVIEVLADFILVLAWFAAIIYFVLIFGLTDNLAYLGLIAGTIFGKDSFKKIHEEFCKD